VRALRLIVRRSIFKVWLLGVLGLPLIFIAVDYVWGTFGFLDLFGSWSYGSKEVEAFEPRDDVLVAILGSLGIACTGFTIKEVVAPRRLLAADDDGIHVPLRGPLRRPHGISWYQVKELRSEDDALLIEVQSRGDLPEDPWGDPNQRSGESRRSDSDHSSFPPRSPTSNCSRPSTKPMPQACKSERAPRTQQGRIDSSPPTPLPRSSRSTNPTSP
jgi:hypothetical protein